MIKRPMLAAAIKDINLLTYPLIASPKLDGIRCIKDGGHAYTRSFKLIPNLHIRKVIETLPDGLDGEILIPFKTFNELSGEVRRSDGVPDFIYCVFDFIDIGEPFSARIKVLKMLDLPMWVRVIDQTVIHTPADLIMYERSCLYAGHEGVITRIPNSPYKEGRSTLKEEWMLKLKRFKDSEAEVVGFTHLMHNNNTEFIGELGQTKRSNHAENKVQSEMMGALMVRDIKTGVLFEIGSGFTEAERLEEWKPGDIVKYKHQPHGAKDKPRSPIFLGRRERWDMDAK